jgi:hypothetical protein
VRGWIKRLERASREDLGSFELLDGSRYYYDPGEAGSEIFMHWMACLHAGNARNWPEPPEILQKLCEAKDVERATALLRGEGTFNFIPYDLEALLSERRLEPASFVSRYDPKVGGHVPIDPYEWELEDLSEQAQSLEDPF